MLHVGLTGNIACGKSHAAGVFAELGAHVIDADALVHELFSRPGCKTHQQVIDQFGAAILSPDGTVDRRTLGAIVFADPEKRAILNSVVHPEVRSEITRRIAALERTGEEGGGIIMVDAALMIETGSYKLYDRLVVVTCNPDLQLQRLMVRDALTEEQARARITAQLPSAEKVKLAHYVVETSGSFSETREQIEAVYRGLLSDAARPRPSASG
jgi:dephospho-CoA kinase